MYYKNHNFYQLLNSFSSSHALPKDDEGFFSTIEKARDVYMELKYGKQSKKPKRGKAGKADSSKKV